MNWVFSSLIFIVFAKTLGLFSSLILKSGLFKKDLISVPIISLFFSSIKICEKLYLLSFASTIEIFPADRKKLFVVEYSNCCKNISFFSKSLIIAGLSDLIILLWLSNKIFSPIRVKPSEVVNVVSPLLKKIFWHFIYLV